VRAIWDKVKITVKTIWNKVKVTVRAIWDKVKITVKTIWNKVKVTVRAIWNKVKEKPLLSILRVLLTLTFVAFVCVLLFECAGTYISKLLGLSDKNEALKFLGIGMGGLLVALLVFSKIKDDPPVSVLIFLIITLGVVFLVVMVSDCPKWIFNRLGIDRTDEPKYEALKFLGIGMGGLLVALQALMSYRRAKAMEDTAESQAKATKEQAKANRHTEQGQRQERLKNAIEHLGHKSDSVRLGGAYELFHLAKDTLEEDPKEKLSQTVLDILCAHIRRTTSKSKYREKYKSKPSEEIQSLLTLLFVQEYDVFKGLNIDLRRSWMKGVYLRNARLENAVLVGVNLQEADLYNAQMQGAVLWKTQMQGAVLADAKMQKATLTDAKMQKATLTDAKMQGAMLVRAQMQGAVLLRTHLQGATLKDTQMQGVASHGDISASFEKRIRERIDEASDLTRVVSENQSSQEFIEISGAITGSYTKEEAEQWIAEYKAMSEVPEDDS